MDLNEPLAAGTRSLRLEELCMALSMFRQEKHLLKYSPWFTAAAMWHQLSLSGCSSLQETEEEKDQL